MTKAERAAVSRARQMLGPEWAVEMTKDGARHNTLKLTRGDERHSIAVARGHNADPEFVARLVAKECREIMLGQRRPACAA